MKKAATSLKMGLIATIVTCWLVPIALVVGMAGFLLGDSYRQSLQQEIDGTGKYALSQVQMRLEGAINSSKAVSYDGVIRSAYREYRQENRPVVLYRTTKEYLTQAFSRDDTYKAVFISFWDVSFGQPYVVTDTTAQQIVQTLQSHTDTILQVMQQEDTDIRFLFLDGELYMVRNLLDSSFTPYATVVMMLDSQQIFGALYALQMENGVLISLDDCMFLIGSDGMIHAVTEVPADNRDICFSAQIDTHTLTVATTAPKYDLWASNPWLRWVILLLTAMVLPLLIVIIFLFRHHVTQPIQTLAEANKQVQSGHRGYQIDRTAPSAEFEALYENFNAMSEELKNQFDRSYLEQQAAQRAQIKALQSQINPHFLNNTLEIINWEARLADNERVSAMIEALSTMLDAALDRDGRPQIPLRQELVYVDAYLYIIKERLGDGFHVHKQIDETLLDTMIPRLLLQPIVENAVEHDITARRGGRLWVRIYQQAAQMILEVEHDGTMTEIDRARIAELLSEKPAQGSQVGLRNVNQRLKLIYGAKASLGICQTENDTILAQISIPTEE